MKKMLFSVPARLFSGLCLVVLFVTGFVAVASFVGPCPAVAAPITPAKPAKDVETRITANNMVYEASKQHVVFNTKVHVVRPDFELWADRLTVYLKPAKSKETTQAGQGEQNTKKSSMPEGMAAGDVDRLVAERNVRMKSEGRTGSCAKAVFTVDNGVLVMEGDPRVSDGENTITGEKIRYFTKENRSEVEGGAKKRVEAVFSSPSKPSREGGKR